MRSKVWGHVVTLEDAVHFAGFMECMRVKCPGFPPSKSCAALHCGVEAAGCAVHSKCRETLECADKCVPEKYTAALGVMPQETVLSAPKVSAPKAMLRQSSPLGATALGDTLDDTLGCISGCPLDESTLAPSPSCVLGNCTSHLAKCLFSSSCRHGVMCEAKCTEPLAKTEDGRAGRGLPMVSHCKHVYFGLFWDFKTVSRLKL